MSEKYSPELGQAVFGNKFQQFEVPEYAIALFFYIKDEIKRIYWNINQEEWDEASSPGFAEIEWRPYWWGDEDEKEASLPNFKYGNLEIHWYKHPGRGMSCNQDLKEMGWIVFFNEIMKELHKIDEENLKI